ncbi:hypothetical protein ACP70R_025173 [Stipagrostis hirtigluma subsp. patula]
MASGYGGGRGGHRGGQQRAAEMTAIASALGIGPRGISPEVADQLKRSIATSDCDRRGMTEMVERMTVHSESENEESMGPLHDAASRGKMDTCKHLVEHLGFDVNSDASDGSGMTPLDCAVSHGKVIAVRYFLAKGADLNMQDCKGFAPLHYAAKQGYDGIARLLLSRGASVDLFSSEGTPLHVAASHGKAGVMQILLEHHANPDKVSADLCTPLAEVLCAAPIRVPVSACLKCLELLVKAGADFDLINPDTPLVIATSKGLTECVQYLLEVGADANIPHNMSGRTPIEIAAMSGGRNLVEMLFPFTSPIQAVSDWSVEGIIIHAKSRHSEVKGKEHNEDSNIELKSHAKVIAEEDTGSSRTYAADKATDEDTKAQLKLHGGYLVAEKDYLGASKFYTEAIKLDPADATLYSNRSLCHLKIGEAKDALHDANACISLRPEWPKGYYRKGAALMSLEEFKEASDAFMDGVKLDPSNVDMQDAYWEAAEAMRKEHLAARSAASLE